MRLNVRQCAIALLCFGYNIRCISSINECDIYIKIEKFSRSMTIYNSTDDWLSNHKKCIFDAAENGNTQILALRSPDVNASHLIEIFHRNFSEKIKTLDFSENGISFVWENAFEVFTMIDHIKLRRNNIHSLSEWSFCNLTKLRKIDLSDNLLTILKPRVFSNLPSLREIHLANNKLRTIADDAFDFTPNIFKILLVNNRLEEIPFRAFREIPLQELGLSSNNLKAINDEIKLLTSLKILDVGNNSLQHVSKYLATIPHLMHVYIGYNNLSSLPKEIATLVNASVVQGLGTNPWRCDCQLFWLIKWVVLGLYDGGEIQCWEPIHINMSDINLARLACDENEFEGLHAEALIVIVMILLVGFCASVSAICLWKNRVVVRPRRHRMLINAKYYQAPTSAVDGTGESVYHTSGNDTLLVSDDKNKWDHNVCEKSTTFGRLQLGKLLGSGAFGDVYEGYTYGYDSMEEKVAVKKIRDTASKEEAENIRKELQNMTEIGNHPNIIQIYGSGYIHGSPIIVMELAEHGDLLAYLHKAETMHHTKIQNLEKWQEKSFLMDKLPKLLVIIWDVAKGMEYMSQMKIVHRDLAARNILLGKNCIAKISDFGLSRDVYESGFYSQKSKGRLPYKWMSPETMSTGKYTTKSDVWSYGVLLWEVVTLGSSPYPGIPPNMLINMYNSGYIMPQPPLCPANLYSVMERCWKFSPDDRPMFKSIVEYLNDLLLLGCNKEYLHIVENEGQ